MPSKSILRTISPYIPSTDKTSNWPCEQFLLPSVKFTHIQTRLIESNQIFFLENQPPNEMIPVDNCESSKAREFLSNTLSLFKNKSSQAQLCLDVILSPGIILVADPSDGRLEKSGAVNDIRILDAFSDGIAASLRFVEDFSMVRVSEKTREDHGIAKQNGIEMIMRGVSEVSQLTEYGNWSSTHSTANSSIGLGLNRIITDMLRMTPLDEEDFRSYRSRASAAGSCRVPTFKSYDTERQYTVLFDLRESRHRMSNRNGKEGGEIRYLRVSIPLTINSYI